METTSETLNTRLSFFLKSSTLRVLLAIMLILPIVFSAQKSYATHMMGADITYRCIDTLKFEITLKWYRDCRGVSLSPGNGPDRLLIRCTTGGSSQTATLNLKSIREITPGLEVKMILLFANHSLKLKTRHCF